MSTVPSVREGPLGWGQHWQWQFDSAGAARGDAPEMFQVAARVPARLSVPGLRSALRHLLDRHEALRTRYRSTTDGAPVQVVRPPGEPNLTLVDTSRGHRHDGADLARELPPPRSLVEGPTGAVMATHSGGWVLNVLIAAPAIAVDGVGLALLRSELEELMDAAAGRRPPALPP